MIQKIYQYISLDENNPCKFAVNCNEHFGYYNISNFSKKKTLFKFDGSSSALTLNTTQNLTKKDKVLICNAHPNNILLLFIPLLGFTEEIEQNLGAKNGYVFHLITFHF